MFQVTDKVHTRYEVIGTASSILDRYLAAELNPDSMMQDQLEQVIMCALSLASKMHQSEGMTAAKKSTPLHSTKLSAQAMADLEVHIGTRLGWHLNPPTAAILIHHLLDFLPVRQRSDALVGALTRHANEVTLLALEGKQLKGQAMIV